MQVAKTINTSPLEELGLSPAEIKIYLVLLELGSAKAGEIIRRTNLQNSVVHLTLGRMLEKGIASFLKKGKVRHYQAVDPRHMLRVLDEKRQRYEAILPALLQMQSRHERQEAEVFEGMRGLKAMLYKAVEDAEAGDEYLYFAFSTESESWEPEVYAFYEQFREDRRRRGIVLKGIAGERARFRYEGRLADKKEVLFVDFPTLQNISVFRNKVIMTPWEDAQISYLITSNHLAQNFKVYFQSIWNRYRREKEALR